MCLAYDSNAKIINLHAIKSFSHATVTSRKIACNSHATYKYISHVKKLISGVKCMRNASNSHVILQYLLHANIFLLHANCKHYQCEELFFACEKYISHATVTSV